MFTFLFCLAHKWPFRLDQRSLTEGGRLNTVDLLVLTSLDYLLLVLKILFIFDTTSDLNEEVFHSTSIPWLECYITRGININKKCYGLKSGNEENVFPIIFRIMVMLYNT
jgi:hypothetical protein